MTLFEILCGVVAVVLAFYYYLTSNFDFWKSRGIRGPQPIPVFGNIKDVMLAKKFIGDYTIELYNNYKDEPMIGIFTRRRPILFLKDLDLIKDVLIKDFSNFSDRDFANIHEKADPLSQHLVALETRRWRLLRTKLSPVFTSGKLKEMVSLISKCANKLDGYIEKLASKKESIECRELTAKYTTDVIGTCAFGIEMNALSDEDSEFRKMGREIFTPSWYKSLRNIIREGTPWLYNILGYILPQTEVAKFFIRLTIDNINYREKNNIFRQDFIDTLRELKKHPETVGNIELTDGLLASQAFVFFLAGFETSSTTMSNALYELALNVQIQDKLREEINQQCAKHDNNLIYENIKDMTYLDKVFKETLRKYPPATLIRRKSVSNYTFKDTKLSISKDQALWIPIYAIQRDPSIYPEPDVFNPERFNEEAVKIRHAMSYFPFGDGPSRGVVNAPPPSMPRIGQPRSVATHPAHSSPSGLATGRSNIVSQSMLNNVQGVVANGWSGLVGGQPTFQTALSPQANSLIRATQSMHNQMSITPKSYSQQSRSRTNNSGTAAQYSGITMRSIAEAEPPPPLVRATVHSNQPNIGVTTTYTTPTLGVPNAVTASTYPQMLGLSQVQDQVQALMPTPITSASNLLHPQRHTSFVHNTSHAKYPPPLIPVNGSSGSSNSGSNSRDSRGRKSLISIPDTQMSSCHVQPYQIQKALVAEKMVPCINLKPYMYAELLMTLPDFVSNFFPACNIENCRQVITDVLHIDLYQGNRLQMKMLMEAGKCSSLTEELPLIQVRNVIKYMPQFKYMFNSGDMVMPSPAHSSEDHIAKKRQRTS